VGTLEFPEVNYEDKYGCGFHSINVPSEWGPEKRARKEAYEAYKFPFN